MKHLTFWKAFKGTALGDIDHKLHRVLPALPALLPRQPGSSAGGTEAWNWLGTKATDPPSAGKDIHHRHKEKKSPSSHPQCPYSSHILYNKALRPKVTAMGLSKYTSVQCFPSTVAYNFRIVTQPAFVRTSGKEKRTIIPSPVLELEVFNNSGVDITEHDLSCYFVKAIVYSDSKNSTADDSFANNGSSNIANLYNYIHYDDYSNNKDLIGTTEVAGDFIKWSDKRRLLFNFNNLGLKEKGQYRLKFMLFACNGFGAPQKLGRVKHIGSVVSSTFTCYSSREFYSPDVVAERDKLLANVVEIKNFEVSSSDSRVSQVPQNIVLTRSRHNSTNSQVPASSTPDPTPLPSRSIQGTISSEGAPVGSTNMPTHSRKRISISLNDEMIDYLDGSPFDNNNHYLSDSNYPASPKRQRSRSPSVSSFTYGEDNLDNTNSDQTFDGFLKSLNSDPLTKHPVTDATKSFADNPEKHQDLSLGNQARTHSDSSVFQHHKNLPSQYPPKPFSAERNSLPNIIVDSQQTETLSNAGSRHLTPVLESSAAAFYTSEAEDDWDGEDEDDVRKLTEEINHSLLKQSNNHITNDMLRHPTNTLALNSNNEQIQYDKSLLQEVNDFNFEMEPFENELTRDISNNSFNNEINDLELHKILSVASLQKSPSLMEDAQDLQRELSANSYLREAFGLEKVLSNNSISNQQVDPFAEQKFDELQDHFLTNNIDFHVGNLQDTNNAQQQDPIFNHISLNDSPNLPIFNEAFQHSGSGSRLQEIKVESAANFPFNFEPNSTQSGFHNVDPSSMFQLNNVLSSPTLQDFNPADNKVETFLNCNSKNAYYPNNADDRTMLNNSIDRHQNTVAPSTIQRSRGPETGVNPGSLSTDLQKLDGSRRQSFNNGLLSPHLSPNLSPHLSPHLGPRIT